MKLSASNIGWTKEQDRVIYDLLKEYGYSGLEIAPTRIFQEIPYAHCIEAKNWSTSLLQEYGFVISSMQSIWFGIQEKVFGTAEERRFLTEYTKQAIDFAQAIGCNNLVFGCPRNRNMLEGADVRVAVPFFRELGEYALSRGTVIGMEANPPIYNTNYVNTTLEALELIEQVNSKGLLLNLDVGTMIQNEEDVEEVRGKVSLINHVHISEPGLKPIQSRTLHTQLRQILETEHYQGFISLEMGKDSLESLKSSLDYVRRVFE